MVLPMKLKGGENENKEIQNYLTNNERIKDLWLAA